MVVKSFLIRECGTGSRSYNAIRNTQNRQMHKESESQQEELKTFLKIRGKAITAVGNRKSEAFPLHNKTIITFYILVFTLPLDVFVSRVIWSEQQSTKKQRWKIAGGVMIKRNFTVFCCLWIINIWAVIVLLALYIFIYGGTTCRPFFPG